MFGVRGALLSQARSPLGHGAEGRRCDINLQEAFFLYRIVGHDYNCDDVLGKTRRAKWQKTQDMKMQYTGAKLFENAPPEFATYVSYVWGLGFDERPNYEFCRELFRDIIR